MTNAIETLYVKENVPTWERQLYLKFLTLFWTSSLTN